MPIKDNDSSIALQQQVKHAISSKEALFIHGGKSKLFYGNTVDATALDISDHTGVVDYDPTELCITVRAGTRLTEIENLLTENNQVLPFEPPHYVDLNQPSDSATIGGAIASGISGPRRAFTGSVRDAILGVKIINGEGEIVTFGGQVMKNVAGYDLSRLMVRSQGTLGVILNVSLRVLPKPSHELTLTLELPQEKALQYCQELRQQQLPITATAWLNNQLNLRLSASEATLEACKQKLAANEIDEGMEFWKSIRDHYHNFFDDRNKPLWRFSVPPATDIISHFEDDQLIEWGGAQRWIHANTPENIIHSIAKSNKGYATLFQSNQTNVTRFTVLDPALLQLHRALKKKMDPHAVFNPNRIYQGL